MSATSVEEQRARKESAKAVAAACVNLWRAGRSSAAESVAEAFVAADVAREDLDRALLLGEVFDLLQTGQARQMREAGIQGPTIRWIADAIERCAQDFDRALSEAEQWGGDAKEERERLEDVLREASLEDGVWTAEALALWVERRPARAPLATRTLRPVGMKFIAISEAAAPILAWARPLPDGRELEEQEERVEKTLSAWWAPLIERSPMAAARLLEQVVQWMDEGSLSVFCAARVGQEALAVWSAIDEPPSREEEREAALARAVEAWSQIESVAPWTFWDAPAWRQAKPATGAKKSGAETLAARTGSFSPFGGRGLTQPPEVEPDPSAWDAFRQRVWRETSRAELRRGRSAGGKTTVTAGGLQTVAGGGHGAFGNGTTSISAGGLQTISGGQGAASPSAAGRDGAERKNFGEWALSLRESRAKFWGERSLRLTGTDVGAQKDVRQSRPMRAEQALAAIEMADAEGLLDVKTFARGFSLSAWMHWCSTQARACAESTERAGSRWGRAFARVAKGCALEPSGLIWACGESSWNEALKKWRGKQDPGAPPVARALIEESDASAWVSMAVSMTLETTQHGEEVIPILMAAAEALGERGVDPCAAIECFDGSSPLDVWRRQTQAVNPITKRSNCMPERVQALGAAIERWALVAQSKAVARAAGLATDEALASSDTERKAKPMRL
jgi:hypothetical protein